MKSLSRTCIALAASATIVMSGLSGCSSSSRAGGQGEGGYAKSSDTLVFGAVPDAVDTQTNYQGLMDYLAEKTGKKVEYHASTDYAALIEATIAGKVDIASLSGFTYVTAMNNGAKIIPISSTVRFKDEEPGYYSEAIVPKDSPIQSVEEFKGKKVCFVDPSSTSGYLFPSYKLIKLGINPETDVTPVFAGKHDVSVSKTGAGKECEAGFAEDSMVKESQDVRVVDRTRVPGAPIVMSASLPEDMQKTIKDTLGEVTIDDIIAAGIKSADTEGFRLAFYANIPVTDDYYDIIRDMCKTTGSKKCQS